MRLLYDESLPPGFAYPLVFARSLTIALARDHPKGLEGRLCVHSQMLAPNPRACD